MDFEGSSQAGYRDLARLVLEFLARCGVAGSWLARWEVFLDLATGSAVSGLGRRFWIQLCRMQPGWFGASGQVGSRSLLVPGTLGVAGSWTVLGWVRAEAHVTLHPARLVLALCRIQPGWFPGLCRSRLLRAHGLLDLAADRAWRFWIQLFIMQPGWFAAIRLGWFQVLARGGWFPACFRVLGGPLRRAGGSSQAGSRLVRCSQAGSRPL